MIQSVKVKNLSLSKDNVRKTNRETGLDSLAADIAAHGLLQNLVVTPLKRAGHFSVKAGGRRLRALQRLIEAGTLPVAHEVQVLVLDDDAVSTEASLAENFQRVPMNPADECTAFKHFIDKGADAEDVAKRFGVTTRFVEQRVRLAELAPCVFEALASGDITLGVAQAYAVTPDTERQARVFESMRNAYYGSNPDNIRRAILNGSVKATDAKARFIGRDAYLEAGGRVERDLFGSEADESWVDLDLIDDLTARKLEAAAAEIAKSQGLAFVTPVIGTSVPYDLERQLHQYHAPLRDLSEDEAVRVAALGDENDALVAQLDSELIDGSEEATAANDRIEAIERELDAIETDRSGVDPEVAAQLGTFIYIGHDGDVRVHSRLFSEQPIHGPSGTERLSDEGGGNGDDAVETGVRYSATLVDELAIQRRQILSAHLANDPTLALDLAIFLMANGVVYATSYVRSHTTLKAPEAAFPISTFRDADSPASAALDEQRQGLDMSWAGLPTLTARFDAFRMLDDQSRAAWLGYATAQTLEPTLNVNGGSRHNGFHDHLGRVLDIDVAKWWRPSAANFFGRVKKDVMLQALEDIGGPILRGRYKDAKKGELAAACASLCGGQGIVEVEIKEKAVAWLPDAMRFEAIELPDRLSSPAAFLDEDEDMSSAEGGEGDDDAADDVEDLEEAA
ncbi:ParB/RepB/Spo0J family partition protein [Sphingomonas sp. 10B4]|uniref:ParB/RepB/Spo0J family partition protein n=1 Tax=Sphingomonas sp. 10B4 TaxID=3048575 RepID=UPI002AB5C547|nr:ParB N-terminal domain-containing protein [Sphingomonas sp. 10B4]MDY7524266.1 ParB N-terminal domain-containing protein [Sphingomonas sp. 10B4]MEB0282268.1 ParB N-terminal domain-containing protein [Sphingomonas sp. 10B4]